MRPMSPLIAGGLLASCSMAPPPPPPPPTPDAMHQYDLLVAGKVAQPAATCMPTFNNNDMFRLDGRTLGFRAGGTSYIVHLSPGCEELTNPSYMLVSQQHGGGGLCRNDIERVVDSGGMPVGSCTIEDITPYVRR